MSPRRTTFPERRPLIVIAIVAAIIALEPPFDSAVAFLAADSLPGRAAMLALLAVAGAAAAARLGLRLAGHGARSPVLVGLVAAAAVATYCLAIDCWVLRGQVDPGVARFLHEPLGLRLLYFMPRAFNENVMYRLFLFPLLALGLASVWRATGRDEALPFWLLLVAMVAAQVVNIGINVVAMTAAAPTAALLIYDALRYVVPGVIWALLFRRNGFATAEIASVGCHLFLQPGYSLLF